MRKQSAVIIGIVIVLALLTVAYLQFGLRIGSGTASAPTGPGALTQDYNGKTFTVHKGDRFALSLGEMEWSLAFAPDNIVSRVKNIAAMRGSQGVYTADNTGTTVLTAEGRPYCAEGQMCAQYIVQFKATIVVQ